MIGAPNVYQIQPAMELAKNVAMLCNPVNIPIAVPTSFDGTTLLIQALEIPSVALA
ncbi:hypothetical protein [Leptospira harrisiae]|uniref:hypothetical protein n=1 Tax=Leptospira harrisiae TaxID=2023189 RepID=UPI001A9C5DB8|nr:hypothetical protein [Leptospira harrisiae]